MIDDLRRTLQFTAITIAPSREAMINVANAAGSTAGLISLLFFPAVLIETRCARHTPRALRALLRRMELPSSASIANYTHAGFRLRRAGSDSFLIELRGMRHGYSPR